MKFTKARIRQLYRGRSEEAIKFQSWLLVFDAFLIGFFVLSPFLERNVWFLVADYVIAFILAVDLGLRGWSYGNWRQWLSKPIVWADIAVLASLVVPVYAANLGFLRILRAYSLINGQAFWRVIADGRYYDSDIAEQVKAGANLAIFIFMMSAIVHASFAARVPAIQSYMDSIYFTVTALSTTGFGDITLPGTWGRILSIIIMLGGVGFFFRLVQVVGRTPKVRYPCHGCGLLRHEPDAVHCKACGEPIRIVHDNE